MWRCSGMLLFIQLKRAVTCVVDAQYACYAKNAEKFTTVERVLEEYSQSQLNPLENIQARLDLAKIRLRRLKKSMIK